jgi:hypothetical protein
METLPGASFCAAEGMQLLEEPRIRRRRGRPRKDAKLEDVKVGCHPCYIFICSLVFTSIKLHLSYSSLHYAFQALSVSVASLTYLIMRDLCFS